MESLHPGDVSSKQRRLDRDCNFIASTQVDRGADFMRSYKGALTNLHGGRGAEPAPMSRHIKCRIDTKCRTPAQDQRLLAFLNLKLVDSAGDLDALLMGRSSAASSVGKSPDIYPDNNLVFPAADGQAHWMVAGPRQQRYAVSGGPDGLFDAIEQCLLANPRHGLTVSRLDDVGYDTTFRTKGVTLGAPDRKS
jgi:hypothetical protein